VPQTLNLKAKGLYTSPNTLAAPLGAMVTADNIAIDDDDVVTIRRGFSRERPLPLAADRGRRQSFYSGSWLAAYDGGKIARWDTGSLAWVPYVGTFNHPDSSLARLRFLEASGNLYATTATGIQVISSPTDTWQACGAPRGLDQSGTLTGSLSWFTTANQVAYRHIWVYKDANGNIKRSAPSGRLVLTNTSGSATNVQLTVSIPAGITSSWYLQVYRSSLSGGSTVTPSDETFLCYEAKPTAGEITAGLVTFTDSQPSSLLSQTLYTSASREGLLQANNEPPLAWDFCLFKNCVIYLNTTSKHYLTITLLGAGSSAFAVNNTITIGGITYTGYGTEDTSTGKFAVYGSFSTTGNTTSGSATITSVASTAGCRIGKSISGTGIPASTTIASFTSTTITLSANATATNPGVTLSMSDGTASQDITDTANSLVRVINRYASSTVYAVYQSGVEDAPGKILLFERSIGGAAFAVTSDNGNYFNPALPTSGTTVSSSNDRFQDAVMISKTGQPWAVPSGNLRRLGSANRKALRCVALKDAVLVFKEDGIWVGTGDDPSNFQFVLLDTAKLLAPDSIATLNNTVRGLFDQGICTVTESAVGKLSRPIAGKILGLDPTSDPVRYKTFGVGYESDGKYILWTVSGSTDTECTQAYVFNVFTHAFTRWTVAATSAMVSPVDDKLYLFDGLSNNARIERKSRVYTDFYDAAYSTAINSYSGTTVYLSTTEFAVAGDVLWVNDNQQARITSVQAAYVVVDSTITWTAGSAEIRKAIEATAEFTPVTSGNPGVECQYPEIEAFFRARDFNSMEVSFASNRSSYYESVTITGGGSGAWGLPAWGDGPWGGDPGDKPGRKFIPRNKQRASQLHVRFRIKEAYASMELLGFSIPARSLDSTKVA
jgi:hypothetical protein